MIAVLTIYSQKFRFRAHSDGSKKRDYCTREQYEGRRHWPFFLRQAKLAFILALLSLSTPIFALDSSQITLNKQQDGALIAILLVFNENERAVADLGYTKSSQPLIQNFALHLYQESKANVKNLQDLSRKTGIDTIDASTALDLQKQGKAELDNLSTLKESSFEEAFIKNRIKAYNLMLNQIDQDMLTRVSNQQLKNYIVETRKRISNYLNQVLQIQIEQGYH